MSKSLTALDKSNVEEKLLIFFDSNNNETLTYTEKFILFVSQFNA